MSGELEVQQPGLGALVTGDALSPERVELVRRTVAKGATDDELAMFFSLAAKYELDPFAKEIYLICPLEQNGERKMKNGRPEPATIITGRDGFLAIANRHPAFDGMASDCIFEGDTFQPVKDDHGRTVGVEHVYAPIEKRLKVRAAYALVYRTDRSVPSYFLARWGVYGEPNARYGDGRLKSWSPWAKYPDAMLVKVPEAVALKHAFSLSGLVAEEELAAGAAIDEGAAPGALEERPRLRTPRISPASRGIGRAHTAPKQEAAAQPDSGQEALATGEPVAETDRDGGGSDEPTTGEEATG